MPAARTIGKCRTRSDGYWGVAAQRIVVIGASSGGVDALRVILAALPASFAAPACVLLHVAAESPALLGDILSRAVEVDHVVPVDAIAPRLVRLLEEQAHSQAGSIREVVRRRDALRLGILEPPA